MNAKDLLTEYLRYYKNITNDRAKLEWIWHLDEHEPDMAKKVRTKVGKFPVHPRLR